MDAHLVDTVINMQVLLQSLAVVCAIEGPLNQFARILLRHDQGHGIQIGPTSSVDAIEKEREKQNSEDVGCASN